MAASSSNKRARPPANLELPVVPGFRFSGIHCGLKPSGAPDLALVAIDGGASVAGVFTRSTVVGAPIEWCRERVRGGRAGALVVTSGIANVATGDAGRRVNRQVAEEVAKRTGASVDETFVAATGVIGRPLPLAVVRRGLGWAAAELSADGLPAVARAIMTTDTVPKGSARSFRSGGRRYRVAGIAKGAGMIEPNMATMLAYVFTDAPVPSPRLRAALRRTAGDTLNRLTIDGETSTSDMALCFASGAGGGAALGGAAAEPFERALHQVLEDLTRQLARDGEGATHLIQVRVLEAKSGAQAERAARRIANSLLVKTAVFGGDPNWGRILQTVGAAGVSLREAGTRVRVGGVTVFDAGRPAAAAALARAERALKRDEVVLEVRLGVGSGEARMWTCDLSYDYVRINAEYTT